MTAKSRHKEPPPERALINWLREGIDYVSGQGLPHPIEHDPSGIDHPLWPFVSLLARDYEKDLFAKFNPFQFIYRPQGEPCPQDSHFMMKTNTQIVGGVIHLTTALRLPAHVYLPQPEIDMQLCEVVFNFASRPMFHPLLIATSIARKTPLDWAAFVSSSRLDGFLENAVAHGLNSPGPESDTPAKTLAGKRDAEPAELRYLLNRFFEEHPPTTREEMDEICSEWMRAKQAEEKREKRRDSGSKQRQNKTQETLRALWLPRALWCRSSSDILEACPSLKTAGETAEDYEADIHRVDEAVFRLGFSRLRNSGHQEHIHAAVMNARTQLAEADGAQA